MTASVNPPRSQWDVIVLGGAAAGENAAQYASQYSGLSTVIVESDLLGGECSYWACMPSKALLRPVGVLEAARSLPGLTTTLDPQAVLDRRDTVIHHLDDASQVDWTLAAGIDLIRGYGRLAGERAIDVTMPDGTTKRITARHAVVIDTGSRPFIPNVSGLPDALPWTSQDVTTMREVPARVIVLGGGVVACEAATWLRGLGVDVHLIHRRTRLLNRHEPFAGTMVTEELQRSGVHLHTGRTATSVQRRHPRATGRGRIHGGEVHLTLNDGHQLLTDEIVVATGRTPNTTDIGLPTIGLTGGGPLPVDDHQTVHVAPGNWLYAIGDVCGRAPLTHMGKYQARIAGQTIAARANGVTELPSSARGHASTPQVVFTNPEIGSTGMTEQQARDAHLDIDTVEYDLAALAGTYVMRPDYRGRAKLVIDRTDDTIVGATFVGAGTAELVYAATTAVVAKIPLPALWHVVPCYPTVSEVWLRLLETLRQQRRDRG